MALEKVLFPVAFGQGIDTKTDPKRVVPGKLLNLENGYFIKRNKINKRNGYDPLSTTILQTGGSLGTSQELGFLDNELLQFNNNYLYSWAPNVNSWNRKGAIYSIENTNDPVVRSTYQQSVPDMAINDNLGVFVYEDSKTGGVNITVKDLETGTIYQNNVNLSSTGLTPKVASIRGSVFVYYIEGTNLRVRILNAQTPYTIGSATTIFSDVHGTYKYFDVVPNESNMLLAYVASGGGGNRIKVAYITDTGVVGSTTTTFPNVLTIAQIVENCLSIVIEPTSQKFIIFYCDNTTGLRYTALAADFSVLQADYVIDSDVVTPALRVTGYPSSTTTIGCFYEKATASGFTYDHLVRHRPLTIVGGGGSSTTILRSVGLASKAFVYNSEYFVNVVFDSTLQASFFTIKSDGTPVAKMLTGQAGGLPAKHVLSSVIVSDTSKFYWPTQIKTKLISQDNTTFTLKGVSLASLQFNQEAPFMNRQINNTLLISGAIVKAYDGAAATECGFHLFPENTTTAITAVGGHLAIGVYSYYVVYEWTDAKGNIYRSAPSVAIPVTITVNDSLVTLTVPTLRITDKSSANSLSDVVIAIYRTIAAGTVPYKVTSVTAPTYNSTTVDTVDIVDTLADASISANEILYTSGGVLENDGVPSATLIDVDKNRALLAGLENGLVLAYSKKGIPGEAISFSDAFRVNLDPLGGNVRTVKFMDDKIIMLKGNYIFYISGEGPDDTGNNNDFSQPILVSSDVGCPYPRSCVLTPLGLMFKSYKGIYLLDRGLNIKYIGEGVEAYNGHTIKSATSLADKNQVRFLTDDGIELVYDYYFDQWSIYTNHGGNGAGLWERTTYSYVRADGTVYVENNETYMDGDVSYSLKILTGWLKVSTLQAFQRVRKAYVLADYYSAHKLQVQVAYDYEQFFTDTYVFNADTVIGSEVYGEEDTEYGGESVYGGATTSVEQFRINLTRQKCESIQFQFEDIFATDPMQSYSISDLLLEIGLKPGGARLPYTKKVASS